MFPINKLFISALLLLFIVESNFERLYTLLLRTSIIKINNIIIIISILFSLHEFYSFFIFLSS